jgi:mono/diheme cytochrome c family protein
MLALVTALWGAGPSGKGNEAGAAVRNEQSADTMRLEGERRFRANCARCHAAPHKFPPRMMTTIVRHMRVRATITDEDMRLVLYYMSQ